MEKAKHSAGLLARMIINWSNHNGAPVSNLKLQKLLYFIQAEFLYKFGRPAFNEPICAWRYGPVCEPVYEAYKSNGIYEIREGQPVTEREIESFSNEEITLIETVLNSCREYMAWEMVEKTREPGSPWDLTYDPEHPYRGGEISLDEIKRCCGPLPGLEA